MKDASVSVLPPRPAAPPGRAFPRIAPSGDSSLVSDPFRRFAFYLALCLVFLRFSMLHEVLTYFTGRNTYILYVFGPPAILGMFLCGGVARTMRGRPAFYWVGFTLLLFLAVPFSSWPGGSVKTVLAFGRSDFPMLFVVAGLTCTWDECKTIMRAIAVASLFGISLGRIFIDADQDRLALSFGTIANSNDYAGHLLLMLPFLLFVGFTTQKLIVRFVCIGAFLYGVALVLQTGSRGAALAVVAGTLVFLVRGSTRQRIALMMLVPVGLIALLVVLPESTRTRLMSFSQSESGVSQEALESSESREYLLKQSIIFTFTHPVFGVGPGQFSSYEGGLRTEDGERGSWHETHNSYTQISSECGIPAAVCYLAALFTTFALLNRFWHNARRLGNSEMITAAFCLMLALTSYCTAITFLNFGYRFYLLAISGLVIAMTEVMAMTLRLESAKRR
jgi:O-antigen ligase